MSQFILFVAANLSKFCTCFALSRFFFQIQNANERFAIPHFLFVLSVEFFAVRTKAEKKTAFNTVKTCPEATRCNVNYLMSLLYGSFFSDTFIRLFFSASENAFRFRLRCLRHFLLRRDLFLLSLFATPTLEFRPLFTYLHL